MLFPEVERSDTGPPSYSEPKYSYLHRSARPEAERVRACLETWFTHYPADERPAFIAAFQSLIDAQFTAAAYELYLHELLLRLGYQVEVHPENPTGKPGRPDFLAKHSNSSDIYVEAVLSTDVSDAARRAEARKAVVYDSLNALGPTDFFIGNARRASNLAAGEEVAALARRVASHTRRQRCIGCCRPQRTLGLAKPQFQARRLEY